MEIRRGREAIALLSGQACVGEANIVCPTCGSHDTRVFRVGAQVDTNRDEPSAPGESAAPTGVTPERRSVLEIVFSCEHCPHHFALVLEQYRGRHLVVVQEEVPNFTGW